MQAHREGKLTLRTHTVPGPAIKSQADAKFFIAARKKFNVSRPVWAQMLHVSPRTVEKWEQGGQISTVAATLVELVSRYPDTIERLQNLPVRVARKHKQSSPEHAAKSPKSVGRMLPVRHTDRASGRL
ncbi:MAG: hypothetical protein LAP21_01345 [Acidobacteriia bacterium]|nr:hypothetical protein [Terriglobia bacterium]